MLSCLLSFEFLTVGEQRTGNNVVALAAARCRWRPLCVLMGESVFLFFRKTWRDRNVLSILLFGSEFRSVAHALRDIWNLCFQPHLFLVCFVPCAWIIVLCSVYSFWLFIFVLFRCPRVDRPPLWAVQPVVWFVLSVASVSTNRQSVAKWTVLDRISSGRCLIHSRRPPLSPAAGLHRRHCLIMIVCHVGLFPFPSTRPSSSFLFLFRTRGDKHLISNRL